jgi:hypothetical protein
MLPGATLNSSPNTNAQFCPRLRSRLRALELVMVENLGGDFAFRDLNGADSKHGLRLFRYPSPCSRDHNIGQLHFLNPCDAHDHIWLRKQDSTELQEERLATLGGRYVQN